MSIFYYSPYFSLEIVIFIETNTYYMIQSESAARLRDMIERAIADHELTRAEMDSIMNIATEDGYIDPQEQTLLNHLHDMIENKMVKIVP
jgi:hypothetical protein